MEKQEKKPKYREPELKQYKAVWLTEETYRILRREKGKQKISMAKIIDNLVKEKWNF